MRMFALQCEPLKTDLLMPSKLVCYLVTDMSIKFLGNITIVHPDDRASTLSGLFFCCTRLNFLLTQKVNFDRRPLRKHYVIPIYGRYTVHGGAHVASFTHRVDVTPRI